MLSVLRMSFPFILHILIETPAALAFAVFPSSTLSVRQPAAEAVIRQYALLILSSNVIAAIFVFHDPNISDGVFLEGRVAAALALYHVGPLMRAVTRIRNDEGQARPLLEQPWLHAWVHAVCLVALAGKGMHWW
ncbi:hypothetical protein P7C71_g4600, partial [Lecanoromycetidae sp. Uapishka_2]